jgi:hypothetical protein
VFADVEPKESLMAGAATEDDHRKSYNDKTVDLPMASDKSESDTAGVADSQGGYHEDVESAAGPYVSLSYASSLTSIDASLASLDSTLLLESEHLGSDTRLGSNPITPRTRIP